MGVRQGGFLRWWRLQPVRGLIAAIVLIAAFGVLTIWIQIIRAPPDEAINVPHQWTCTKRGSYCERTGGFDRKGRPWGTEVPKWYSGPPTKQDAAQRAMGPGR